MEESSLPVRVRFAPAPTGFLHIGNLRTAIFNFLFARHNKGLYLIRIEDTDIERLKPEYTESIFDSLHWCDIASDEPVIVQSERIHEYQKVLNQLLNEGKVYRCYCTPEEIKQRVIVTEGQEYVKYDGYCWRYRNEIHDRSYTIRFRLPEDQKTIMFDDLIRGSVSFDRDQFDDFIIARSDGSPMYNFVVVIDDAFMKITHIIRGEDHISNTPKQILLYRACGFRVPFFAHLPLILGPSGNRLSKREAAVSVIDYKKNGFLPDALFNYLVRLGWSYGDQEIFTRQELITYFSLDHVGKKGAIFDIKKLEWFNGIYIRSKTAVALLDYITNHLDKHFINQLHEWSREQLLFLIDLYKQRAKTMLDIIEPIKSLYKYPESYNDADIKKWVNTHTSAYIREIINVLTITHWEKDSITKAITQLAENKQIPLVAFAQPIRFALTGKSNAPGVFELLYIIGKEESIRRLERLLHFIGG